MIETILFCAMCVSVRSLPDAPKPKVADRNFYLAMATLAASKAADAYETSQMLSRGCIENNPLLGHHPSDAHIAGFFAASFAVSAGASYFVKRYGQRHRWARHLWLVIPVADAAQHSYLAAKDVGLTCVIPPTRTPVDVYIGPIR